MTAAVTVDRLGVLEETIGAGIATFRQVGEALAAIRDERLWQGSHRSFADYCRDRWTLSPAAAYRRIDQADDARKRDLPDGETRSQRQLAAERKAAKDNDGSNPSRARDAIDVTSVMRMVEADDSPTPDQAPDGNPQPQAAQGPGGGSQATPQEPGRPDTPRLNHILEMMRSCPPDVAGAVADLEQYREVLGWARSFQSTYQSMHPRPVDVAASHEVTTRFKSNGKTPAHT